VSVLEMAVLGLLKDQDMHGYELRKRLGDVFGLSAAVSFGSLYPALARLEVAGAVRAVPSPSARTAQGASTSTAERRASRRRKVYSITLLGSQLFEELLTDSQGSSEDERSFNLRLAFARYLPPEARLGLLEHRRAVLGERLAQLTARARARRDDRYMRILSERQQEALSRDVSWLDQLIQEERAGKGADEPRAPLGAGDIPAPRSAPHATAPSTPVSKLVPLASASQLQRAASKAAPAAPHQQLPSP